MTNNECDALRAGDVIRSKKTGALRVVCSTGTSKRTGRIAVVFLVKTGHSWTDPNPAAAYNSWVIVHDFDVTGRPRMLKLLRTIPLFFAFDGRVTRAAVEHPDE